MRRSSQDPVYCTGVCTKGELHLELIETLPKIVRAFAGRPSRVSMHPELRTHQTLWLDPRGKESFLEAQCLLDHRTN